MSYRADKQVIDTHTHGHTDRHTEAGDDNTHRPKLASGKKSLENSDGRAEQTDGPTDRWTLPRHDITIFQTGI